MPGICRVSSTKGIHYSIFDCTSKLAVGPGTLGRKKDLPWQALYIVIRYDLRSTAEYAVVREHAATPINLLLVEFGLRRDGERDEPRSLIGSPEPTVGYDRLVVSQSLLVVKNTKSVMDLKTQMPSSTSARY